MRYWFRKNRLAEVDVVDHKYRQRHQVGRSREVQEAQDSDCGAGVVTIGLRIGEQSESEFVILGYRDGEEVGDWQSGG